jgi:hypothetical protein
MSKELEPMEVGYSYLPSAKNELKRLNTKLPSSYGVTDM